MREKLKKPTNYSQSVCMPSYGMNNAHYNTKYACMLTGYLWVGHYTVDSLCVDGQSLAREEGDVAAGMGAAIAVVDVRVQVHIVGTLRRELLTAVYNKTY